MWSPSAFLAMALPGWPEMLVIFGLVLILFGPKRLPEIAEAMGKSIRKFKTATKEAKREVQREMDDAGQELRNEAPSEDNPTDRNEV